MKLTALYCVCCWGQQSSRKLLEKKGERMKRGWVGTIKYLQVQLAVGFQDEEMGCQINRCRILGSVSRISNSLTQPISFLLFISPPPFFISAPCQPRNTPLPRLSLQHSLYLPFKEPLFRKTKVWAQRCIAPWLNGVLSSALSVNSVLKYYMNYTSNWADI